jgi:hypothetical protein|tara:strand:- start:586 stop:822 length:237 start_codon:yes stop_codon:yes gene_type:complete
MDILNSEKKLLHILTQLKKSPMPYSVLKTLSGYRSKNGREFVELLKLGLRSNKIHLNYGTRTYCLMKDRDDWLWVKDE